MAPLDLSGAEMVEAPEFVLLRGKRGAGSVHSLLPNFSVDVGIHHGHEGLRPIGIFVSEVLQLLFIPFEQPLGPILADMVIQTFSVSFLLPCSRLTVRLSFFPFFLLQNNFFSSSEHN